MVDAHPIVVIHGAAAYQASEMTSIRERQIWIAEHLGTRLSAEDLADRMATSVRNFERVCTREVGTTPRRYRELAEQAVGD